MNRTRLVALVAAIAITATACAGATTATSTGSQPSDPENNGQGAGVELVSPTETDRPLDLSGGTVSSQEGVTVVSGDPTADLSADVRQATAPWPTDWARRTVDPRRVPPRHRNNGSP